MRALDAAGIANCHWKSNEHLSAALDGETDLDLLVDPSRRDDALRVIACAGFHRFDVAWSRRYPGLEDHLALDPSGRTHHLHLHFALDAGEPHLKSYRLPWLDRVLSTAVVDPQHGVHITAPALEVVLLLTRATMKVSIRERIQRAGLSSHDRRELDWLLERTTLEAIGSEATDCFDANTADSYVELARRRDHRSLMLLRRTARRELAAHRRLGPIGATSARLVRTLAWMGSGVARRKLDRPVRFARQVPGGGKVVAVVGADGAGKSTLVAQLLEKLRRDVDTMGLYLGSGAGDVSLLRRPLVVLRRWRSTDAGSTTHVDPSGSRPRVIDPPLLVWACVLAREKHRRVRAAFAARRRGLVVVADRWPQVVFDGHGDGPLLAAWRSASGMKGWVSQWEHRIYAEAAQGGPDIVVRLHVSPDVARSRRPGHDPDDLRRRIEMVDALDFPAGTEVLEVDANRAADVVAQEVTAAIWRSITNTAAGATT